MKKNSPQLMFIFPHPKLARLESVLSSVRSVWFVTEPRMKRIRSTWAADPSSTSQRCRCCPYSRKSAFQATFL